MEIVQNLRFTESVGYNTTKIGLYTWNMTGKRVRSMKIILDYKPIKLLEKNREFFNQSVVSYKNSAVVAAYELTANQVRVFVQLNRGTKDPFNGIGIVLPEVGNGIVIRGKLFDEPHHFNVAPAFLLQNSGGAHPVQITIDEQFEQYGRVISRSSTFGKAHFKTHLS